MALGIDYNIFLMTRVREETLQFGTRSGVLRGLSVTGGVITSAGLVLASTFAVLGVLPIVFLAEIGFAVAFGVLLDTFIVRSLLVPALAYDIGRTIWWPSKLARAEQPGPARPGLRDLTSAQGVGSRRGSIRSSTTEPASPPVPPDDVGALARALGERLDQLRAAIVQPHPVVRAVGLPRACRRRRARAPAGVGAAPSRSEHRCRTAKSQTVADRVKTGAERVGRAAPEPADRARTHPGQHHTGVPDARQDLVQAVRTPDRPVG